MVHWSFLPKWWTSGCNYSSSLNKVSWYTHSCSHVTLQRLTVQLHTGIGLVCLLSGNVCIFHPIKQKSDLIFHGSCSCKSKIEASKGLSLSTCMTNKHWDRNAASQKLLLLFPFSATSVQLLTIRAGVSAATSQKWVHFVQGKKRNTGDVFRDTERAKRRPLPVPTENRSAICVFGTWIVHSPAQFKEYIVQICLQSTLRMTEILNHFFCTHLLQITGKLPNHCPSLEKIHQLTTTYIILRKTSQPTSNFTTVLPTMWTSHSSIPLNVCQSTVVLLNLNQ